MVGPQIETVDRMGTFLGTLRVPAKNFNLGQALLEAGLGKLHPSFDTDRVDRALAAAEAAARDARLKVLFGTLLFCLFLPPNLFCLSSLPLVSALLYLSHSFPLILSLALLSLPLSLPLVFSAPVSLWLFFSALLSLSYSNRREASSSIPLQSRLRFPFPTSPFPSPCAGMCRSE